MSLSPFFCWDFSSNQPTNFHNSTVSPSNATDSHPVSSFNKWVVQLLMFGRSAWCIFVFCYHHHHHHHCHNPVLKYCCFCCLSTILFLSLHHIFHVISVTCLLYLMHFSDDSLLASRFFPQNLVNAFYFSILQSAAAFHFHFRIEREKRNESEAHSDTYMF